MATKASDVQPAPWRSGRRLAIRWALLVALSFVLLAPAVGQRNPASPSSPDAATIASIERARSLIQHGDPQAALAVLTPPPARGPAASQIHTLRGICFAMLDQPIESTAEFDQAIALRSNDAPTYFSAGLAAARFNNLDRAIGLLAAAARLDPALPGVHYNEALVLARTGRYADSEALVDQEIASKSHSAEPPAALWKLKARDAYSQKKWQDTIDSYRKVLTYTPDSGEAYSAIGEALYSLNRPQESEVALRKAIALDPGNGNAHKLLARLYQDEGKSDAADAELEAVLRLNPTDQEAIYRLLRIYRAKGDRADVARLQQQLRAMMATEMKGSTDETKATVLNNAGIDLEKKGDLAGALADYEQAAHIDAANIVFARNAALLLCKMGSAQEAIRYLRDILTLDPDDAESLQILSVANELAAGNRTGKKELPASQSSR